MKNKKKYMLQKMKKVFYVPNKRHKQVISYTPTTLTDNMYMLVRDVVNQKRPVLVRSSRIVVFESNLLVNSVELVETASAMAGLFD